MSSLQEKFDQLSSTYPPQMRASLVLPLLQLMQKEHGHIRAQDANIVAAYTGVPTVQVMEALSWYTMFNRQPVGRHVVKVCRNIACSLRGAERIVGQLERQLGIKIGETTADGRCTLLTVECMASCGSAPAMQINDTHYDQLSEEKVARIIEALV